MTATTTSGWLGGRIRLTQPAKGYRVAIDAALLAAAVPAEGLTRALELGSGVGAAALALAVRAPAARIEGVELQPELAALAAENVQANGLGDRVAIRQGDVLALDADGNAYDAVFFNPPYLAADAGNPSADRMRRVATVEGPATLGDWMRAARRAVRSGGAVVLIHRADRLADVLSEMAAADIGAPVVCPLWPRLGEEAKRVIVRGRAGREGRLRLTPGLVLHAADGRFTAAAKAALEDAVELTL